MASRRLLWHQPQLAHGLNEARSADRSALGEPGVGLGAPDEGRRPDSITGEGAVGHVVDRATERLDRQAGVLAGRLEAPVLVKLSADHHALSQDAADLDDGAPSCEAKFSRGANAPIPLGLATVLSAHGW